MYQHAGYCSWPPQRGRADLWGGVYLACGMRPGRLSREDSEGTSLPSFHQPLVSHWSEITPWGVNSPTVLQKRNLSCSRGIRGNAKGGCRIQVAFHRAHYRAVSLKLCWVTFKKNFPTYDGQMIVWHARKMIYLRNDIPKKPATYTLSTTATEHVSHSWRGPEGSFMAK